MPHQCTSCGRVFPDGSKEMLSGCPDCGGNKFQFKPKGRSETAPDASSGTPDSASGTPDSASGTPDSPSDPVGSSDVDSDPTTEPSETPSSGVTTGSGSSEQRSELASTPDASAVDPERDTDGSQQLNETESENTAQASARSDVVTPDELDRASRSISPDANDDDDPVSTGSEPEADERPGIENLRDELNDQFESIRIVSPGQYELNLMELYDRQEYIISLQEDGRYVIEMPDAWGVSDE